MFIYEYTENHKPSESIFPTREMAVKQAIRDMSKGTIYPKAIYHVVMDRNAIERLWEDQRQAA